MTDKFLYLDGAVPTEKTATVASTGVLEAGKMVALDANGKLDTSLLPTGIAADTSTVAASENLSAGDLVNLYEATGAKCRKADAAAAGKPAHGFVLASVTSGQNATVYHEGTIVGLTGVTAGDLYLSSTVPGGFVSAPPSGAGKVVQCIGVGTSTTTINFEAKQHFVLA